MALTTLVLATRNLHKTAEIQNVLGDRFHYRTLRDLPVAPAVDEGDATFTGNARLKSAGIVRWLLEAKTPLRNASWAVLADDSGLEVDALGGAPGVHSARFASAEFGLRGNAPDAANNAKLLRLLSPFPAERRTARFRCALALTQGDPSMVTTIFEGTCEGHIGFLPRGSQGFGYDPLFIPIQHSATFAELGDETKNQISHRARALTAMGAWLKRQR